MSVYVTFDSKLFITDVTRVRTFTSMHSFVNIKTAFLSKAFQTYIALKWPLTGVSSHVNL